jgi:hypothetical protein
MPITSFLHGQAFDRATIRSMNTAFQDVCRTLGLTDRADGATEMVAKKIIELAQQGARDPIRIANAVLESVRAGK